jgi:hypothetical protein
MLSPQGSRERLDGLLSLLADNELHFLIP